MVTNSVPAPTLAAPAVSNPSLHPWSLAAGGIV